MEWLYVIVLIVMCELMNQIIQIWSYRGNRKPPKGNEVRNRMLGMEADKLFARPAMKKAKKFKERERRKKKGKKKYGKETKPIKMYNNGSKLSSHSSKPLRASPAVIQNYQHPKPNFGSQK